MLQLNKRGRRISYFVGADLVSARPATNDAAAICVGAGRVARPPLRVCRPTGGHKVRPYDLDGPEFVARRAGNKSAFTRV